jgi:CheY-like chemotaxis protein
VRPVASVTVLYVEDEESDVLFMRHAFGRAGFEHALRSVGDGREAIAYLAGKNGYADRAQHPLPSLIFLDLNLPILSGFEVLRWVRARPQFAQLTVVVFSSSSRQEDKAKAGELGANDYIEKPRSGLAFVDVVQRVKERWLT